ncbi:MAG: cell division protein [Flavobacteriales bacterium]
MPVIDLLTEISAPIQLVFNLSRNLDMHQRSMSHTNEKAIAGKTSGLIELGETVTWQARHLGITQKLTIEITEMEAPFFFVDEQVEGAFKSFRHEHYFKEDKGITVMTDKFHFTSPLGPLGKLADVLFLKKYMTNLLQTRNVALKREAELLRS